MTYVSGHVHFKGAGSKLQSPKVCVQSCLAPSAHFPALGTSCISLCIHGSDCIFLHFLGWKSQRETKRENDFNCELKSDYNNKFLCCWRLSRVEMMCLPFYWSSNHVAPKLNLFLTPWRFFVPNFMLSSALWSGFFCFLTHHDPRPDLGLICLVKKRKIRVVGKFKEHRFAVRRGIALLIFHTNNKNKKKWKKKKTVIGAFFPQIRSVH